MLQSDSGNHDATTNDDNSGWPTDNENRHIRWWPSRPLERTMMLAALMSKDRAMMLVVAMLTTRTMRTQRMLMMVRVIKGIVLLARAQVTVARTLMAMLAMVMATKKASTTAQITTMTPSTRITMLKGMRGLMSMVNMPHNESTQPVEPQKRPATRVYPSLALPESTHHVVYRLAYHVGRAPRRHGATRQATPMQACRRINASCV